HRSVLQPRPRAPLLPYTTLFRSRAFLIRWQASGKLACSVITVSLGALSPMKSNPSGPYKRHRGSRFMLVTQQTWISTHGGACTADRKSTRLNSSHVKNSYAVFCL